MLTAKRWELLTLCGAGPVSIREASRRVGRDVKSVHGDITALVKAGVLERATDGGVVFPYDAVEDRESCCEPRGRGAERPCCTATPPPSEREPKRSQLRGDPSSSSCAESVTPTA